MWRARFVIGGVVVLLIGLFIGVYYALISCATNLTEAQRLGEPWCGYSHAYAAAGLLLTAVGAAFLALGWKSHRSGTDRSIDSRPGVGT